jgi:hypothetical protein
MKASQSTWDANFQLPATYLSFSNASNQKRLVSSYFLEGAYGLRG